MNKIKNLRNRLFENIIYLNKKDKIREGVEKLTDDEGDIHYFRDDSAITYAFGFINNDLILSKNHGTHGEAIKEYIGMKTNERDFDFTMFNKVAKSIKYEGRLWLNFDTISFRDQFVPDHIINQVKQDLKKYFPNKDFSNFKIDIKKYQSIYA
jgi:hypothetical protein